MTPDERFARHEQWLQDHDRAMAEIKALLAETAQIQRKQSAVMLELTQHVVRLLERQEGNGSGGQP